MVAAMNHTGLVGHHIQELYTNPGPGPGPEGYGEHHAINRDLWLQIFEDKILPFVGNYANGEENSIVVIDNASLHWGSDEEQMQNALIGLIQRVGGKVFFTPPFCPDANAIEWMFGHMNKTIARDRPLANSDPRSAIELGLLSVGQERCTNFIMESDRIVNTWYRPEIFGPEH